MLDGRGVATAAWNLVQCEEYHHRTIHLDSGAINHSGKVLAKLSFRKPLGGPHV